MRSSLAVVLFALCASAGVYADPWDVPAVNASALPAPCRGPALAAGDAPTPAAREAADIAAANCAAQAKLAALTIAPTAASEAAIADAVRPSLALLEAVVDDGDPVAGAVAKHAEADLYQGIAVRLLASVPAAPPGASEEALRAHAQLVERAVRLARPWQRRAEIAYRETQALVDGLTPAQRRDPVVGAAVGDARVEQRAQPPAMR